MDGLPTFSLEAMGDQRLVTAVPAETGTVVVTEGGDLARVDASERALIAREVLPGVATSGDLVAFSQRGRDESSDVHVAVGARVRRLTRGMRAVVVALSPSGDEVLFLASARGLPAMWTVGVAGGEPEQITNRDLDRVPGRAPEGFVPPPRERGGVRWAGDELEIAAADGLWRVDADSGEVLSRPGVLP
jgi:hypothetical protein